MEVVYFFLVVFLVEFFIICGLIYVIDHYKDMDLENEDYELFKAMRICEESGILNILRMVFLPFLSFNIILGILACLEAISITLR